MAVPKSLRQRAADLALVRYGPEISALTALLREAQSNRAQTIDTARSVSTLLQSNIDAARPVVTRNYEGAQATANAQNAVTAASLGARPPGDPYAAAAAIEQGGLASRLAESKAAELTSLTDQRIGAAAGYGAARTAADRAYQTARGKISQRGEDLARESGAYSASTIQQLLDDAAKTDASNANAAAGRDSATLNALIGQGLMPTYDKAGNITGYAPLPGGKADPNAPGNKKPNKGKGWASQEAQAGATDTIGTAHNEAKDFKASGATRSEALGFLVNGVADIPARPKYRTIKRNGREIQQRVLKDGVQVMTDPIPGVDPIKSSLYAQAGVEMAYDGHLSKRTQELLHKRGIQLAPLGLTTYGDYRRQVAQALGTIQRPANAPAPGGYRPT